MFGPRRWLVPHLAINTSLKSESITISNDFSVVLTLRRTQVSAKAVHISLPNNSIKLGDSIGLVERLLLGVMLFARCGTSGLLPSDWSLSCTLRRPLLAPTKVRLSCGVRPASRHFPRRRALRDQMTMDANGKCRVLNTSGLKIGRDTLLGTLRQIAGMNPNPTWQETKIGDRSPHCGWKRNGSVV